MMERTDDDGRWESHDDGTTWLLVEPSQALLDARAAEPEPPAPPPSAEERIAALEAQLSERGT